MNFANNLRFLRKKRKLGQEDIANLFGYKNYTTVQKWESGKAEPDLSVVFKLSELFNVSMDDLVNKDLTQEVIFKDTIKFNNSLKINLDKAIKEDNKKLLEVIEKVSQLNIEDLLFVEKIVDSILNKKD